MSESGVSDRQIRQAFAVMACVSTLGLVYASFLPMIYRSLPLDLALEKFWELPWLRLNVYRRADWVANALVVIPVGWFAAGAVDWGRSSRKVLLFLGPIISAFLVAVVLAIEFAQAWFPTRTQSLNDVVAGCIGAFLGPIAWFLTGRALVSAMLLVRYAHVNHRRLWYACYVYVFLNLVHAVLPLDVMLSVSEWSQKMAEGRLILLPEFPPSWIELRGWALAAFRTAPLAFVVSLIRGPQTGVKAAIALAAVCELLQIPIFSRTASFADFLASLVGVGGGLLVYLYRNTLMDLLKQARVWLGFAVAGTVMVVFITLAKTSRIVTAPREIAGRWQAFWDWPMAKYYYMSEFGALTTFSYKVLLFAALGFCWRTAASLVDPSRRLWIHLAAAVFSIAAAIAIEVGQVYLPPGIPDAFDILVYTMGAALGYLVFWFVNPTRIPTDRTSI